MAQSQYAQPSDLTALALSPAAAARFGQTAISAQLQAASSLIDSYIVSQFTLPLQTDPQGWDMSLTRSTCNIAAYLLYVQFGFNPSTPADQAIVARYNSEISWLEQVRDKKLFPVWVDSSGSATVTEEAGPYIISDPPVGFTQRGVTDGGGNGWNNNGGW